MTGSEIYKRTDAYERGASTIRLHAPQWKLLLAFDGQRSLTEVALSIGLSFAEALPYAEHFLEEEWIAEQPITLEQYLKRTGAASVSALGAAVPPPVVLHEPKPEGPAPANGSAAANPLPGVPATETPALPPASAAEAPKNVPAGPLRLSAVVDHIVGQADSSALGQITAYRVFLRVPPALLQAEDIVSVHLVNDSTQVRTAALKQAIAEVIRDVTKRPLPDSAFSAA